MTPFGWVIQYLTFSIAANENFFFQTHVKKKQNPRADCTVYFKTIQQRHTMPKAFSIPPDAVHLWVKQGKTDHMAILEDPAILSKLKAMRETESFSLADLSILDLATETVAVRWATTGQKDTIEPSTIRFRDLQAEGRGSKRSSRRRAASQPLPEAPANPVGTRSRKRQRNEPGGLEQSKSTKDSTNVSSIVTTNSKDSWNSTIETSVSNDDDDNDDNEDAYFDSSDDEAVARRMKKKIQERVNANKEQRTAERIQYSEETNYKTNNKKKARTLAPAHASGKDRIYGDRDDLEKDGVAPPNNGKTNMANFLKMKRFFSKLL